jgi:hypothetical protein
MATKNTKTPAAAPKISTASTNSAPTTGFEVFQGSTRSSTQPPQVTIRKSGQLVLTPAAVDLFEGDDVTHVQIGYDSTTGAVGFRPAEQGARGRYRLCEQKNGSYVVSGKRFLQHHGLMVDSAARYQAEVVGKGIVGFTVEGQADKGKAAAA